MTKYRKKPVVIEAEQYKEGMEDGFEERYIDPDDCNKTWGIPITGDDVCILTPYIKNPQDEFIYLISNSDWIITEVNGRRSTCNHDIFEETYEPVESDQKHVCGPYIDVDVVAHRCTKCGKTLIYEVNVSTDKLKCIGTLGLPE